MITKEAVKQVMDEVDALLVHERLGLVYGQVFDVIAEHPKFFGAIGNSNARDE